jgi:hypothetical protein
LGGEVRGIGWKGVREKMAEKHYPERYRRFKGCFGSSLTKQYSYGIQKEELAKHLSMRDESLNNTLNSLNTVMKHPKTVLDMRKVESVKIGRAHV